MAEVKRGAYFIEEIAEGVYKIYEQREATMYLVCGKERACLIDTAFGLSDLKALVRELTDLPVTVVNTHGHCDHVMGNAWFFDGGAGRAYLHPADWAMYEEIAAGYADMVRQPWVQEKYTPFLAGLDPDAVRFPKAAELRGGDVIGLGGKALRVVETPGHTAGSVVLLDSGSKICFSGDTILEHPWLFLPESLPVETYLASLIRARDAICAEGIERIYSGHFSFRPLTPGDLDTMIAGMEKVAAGTAEGKPFWNREGSGTEYVFGDWSVLCKNRN